MPNGADFDPTPLDSAWGDGDDATAAITTSVWGDGDEATAAILEAVPTRRKRKHMAAARAGDADDGDLFAGVGDFDPTSVWGDGDEVTTAIRRQAADC